MTHPQRIHLLLGLLAWTLLWALLMGEQLHQRKPSPLKKHGRPAISLFRRGLDQLTQIIHQSSLNMPNNINPFYCRVLSARRIYHLDTVPVEMLHLLSRDCPISMSSRVITLRIEDLPALYSTLPLGAISLGTRWASSYQKVHLRTFSAFSSRACPLFTNEYTHVSFLNHSITWSSVSCCASLTREIPTASSCPTGTCAT